MHTRLLHAGFLALGLALATACGGSDPYSTDPSPGTGGGGGSASTDITVHDNFFQPNATTVPVGTKVTWTWAGSMSHNVTFDDGPASPTQASGTFSRTFQTAGTYRYHCTIHGVAMSGTVTVSAGGGSRGSGGY
jgi:plastocyanin